MLVTTCNIVSILTVLMVNECMQLCTCDGRACACAGTAFEKAHARIKRRVYEPIMGHSRLIESHALSTMRARPQLGHYVDQSSSIKHLTEKSCFSINVRKNTQKCTRHSACTMRHIHTLWDTT